MPIKPDPSWTEPVLDPQHIDHAEDNLRHSLQLFADSPDDVMVLTATSNVYGKGIRTGLTMRDLRLIAKYLEESV